jgi:hypothetical protein
MFLAMSMMLAAGLTGCGGMNGTVPVSPMLFMLKNTQPVAHPKNAPEVASLTTTTAQNE